MRLIDQEKDRIIDVISTFVENKAMLYLFGSRADDKFKGGDIDLLVVTRDAVKLRQNKHRILAQLKNAIGEQKIDLLVTQDTTTDPFVQKILPTCVLLKQW
jgi:uncharacterized protein